MLVGGAIFEDHQPANIIVLVGTKPDPNATDAVGAKIFHDSATNLCGHDLALVVLDRKLASPIAPIRLGASATMNERFTAVGWGTDGTAFPKVRQQRANVEVQALGPIVLDLATGHRVAIGSNELLTDEADCAGDSGSPALDATTGAIIGVASRSGVGASDPAAPCRNSKNVYSVPSGFKDVISAAFEGSGEEVWLEGNPEPPRAAPTAPPATSSSKGCTVQAAGERAGFDGWAVGALAGLAIALRRRRHTTSPDV
jgi:MYXO-CTERM domain-containing protein